MTGGTADLTAFAAAHPGEKVELDYSAKVTASGPTESDAAESKDTLTVGWDDDVTRSSEASVSLLSFRFGLDKVSAADTTQHLSGAGFKVQARTAGSSRAARAGRSPRTSPGPPSSRPATTAC